MLVLPDTRRDTSFGPPDKTSLWKLVFELRVIRQKESRELGPGSEHCRSQALPCVLGMQRPRALVPGQPGSLGELVKAVARMCDLTLSGGRGAGPGRCC